MPDDPAASAAKDDAGNKAAAAAAKQPETVTLSKADHDRLQGTLGDLLKKEKDREAAEKTKQDEESRKRGEFEKLIAERDKEIDTLKPWQERYATRVKAEHDRRIKIIEKADAKVKAQFKTGDNLSLEDREHNLAKLDEYETLGLLGSGGGKEVVVDTEGAGGSTAVIAKSASGGGKEKWDPLSS
jgi:hypothetical protein